MVLNKIKYLLVNMNWWMRNVMLKSDWGDYYLTAKRMVYRYADYIVDEINNS